MALREGQETHDNGKTQNLRGFGSRQLQTVDQILNYEGELTKKKFKDFFNKNVAAL